MKYIKVYLLLLLLLNIYGTKASPLTHRSIGVAVGNRAPVFITNITPPPNSVYRAGTGFGISVNFTDFVNVDVSLGRPSISLMIGTQRVEALYLTGSGTPTLTFIYTVKNGDVDNDGISLFTTAIQNSLSITDDAGGAVTAIIPDPGVMTNVKVDGIPPLINGVWVPAPGTYNNGSQLTFTVLFEADLRMVAGFGPLLNLVIGNNTRKVPLEVFNGTSGFMRFSYTVQSDDLDADGITVGAQLDMNGTVIADAAGNPLNPQLNNVSASNDVKVDGVPPTAVISAASTTVNQPFTATITFSEEVRGTPIVTASGCTVGNIQTADNKVFTVDVAPVNASGSIQVPANGSIDLANNGGTASNVFSFTYDIAKPVISSVTVPAGGRYKAGDVLSFTVNYDDNIILNTTGGVPYLTLLLDSGPQILTFASQGANTITFTHQVVPGEEDQTGLALAPNLVLNGATIRDAAGNDADNALSNIGPTGSVVVDANPLVVTAVTVPANGYYKAGDVLNFDVRFNEPWALNMSNGRPTLDIVVGGITKQAVHSGYNGNGFIFSYTVQAGDMDMDGITVVSPLSLNGSTVKDLAGNALIPVLNGVGSTTGVFVNTAVPTVTISTTETSPLNHPFTATITFSEPVTGLTIADLISINATASNLTTSDNITYTVLLTPAAGSASLSVPANSAINIGGNGNTASNVLYFTYDVTSPAITSVTVPAAKTYSANEVLSFTVNYSENIVADTRNGVPFINLVLASGTHNAPLTVIGTNYLTFSYTVQNGDEDLTGPSLGVTMNLNGSTIRDAAGNNAVMTLQNVASLQNVLVDANAPVVTSVAVPANGYYHTGDQLNFAVNFSESTVVTTTGGIPFINVTIGSTVQKAFYTSGSGSNQLLFSYSVQNGEMDMDGIALGAITLNSGMIRDAAGNDAVLTLNSVGSTAGVLVNTNIPSVVLTTTAGPLVNAPFTITATFSEPVINYPALALSNCTVSNIATADNQVFTGLVTPSGPSGTSGTIQVVAHTAQNAGLNWNTASGVLSFTYDNQAPQITSVTVPANKTYREHEVLSFNVYYNENIVADTTHGVPFISLVLASGSHNTPLTAIGANYLTFSYTVQNGDEDLTGPSLGTAMVLNNGTIRDAVGNDAGLILINVASLQSVLVDAKAPVVTSVAVPANKYYHTGDPLNFTVNFSENAVITGTPSIDVTIGSVVRKAVYTSGSGSAHLTFSYTVQNGDMDMDGIALGAMTLNSGTIQDAAGNDAVSTLNSVGSTAGVLVNTNIPSVVLTTAAGPLVNAPFTVTATFSEAVTSVPAFALSNCTVSNVSTTDNKVFTALVTPTGTNGTIQIPDSTTQNAGQNWNTASGIISFTYDNQAPQITNVTVPANKTYKQNEVLSFNVYYNENIVADTTHGVPFLSLILASGAHNAPLTAIGANYLTFSYTVQNGDEDLTGPALGTVMVLNSATIRDAVGNDAALTLQNVSSLNNVWVDAKAPVVTSVAVPANSYYHTGDQLNFTVNFSENAIVTGTPAIDVTIGSTVRKAAYASGNATTHLTFSYTIQNGDMDMDGITVGALTLNSGTIRDAAGNDAVLTLNSVASTAGVFVNTNIPSVILTTTAGPLVNAPFTVTATFSEAVINVPAFALSNCTVSNVTTTDNKVFTALVTPTGANGTIQVPDSTTQNAGQNWNTASGVLSFTFDNQAPQITNVTVPANKTYRKNEVLSFNVYYNENIVADTTHGAPFISLVLASGVHNASLTAIGANYLTFSYTVQNGDMDMDGITVGALTLNSGTIQDAAGNDAVLTLNNIGSTAGVLVNTNIPSVVLTTIAGPLVNAPFTVTATFSEAVINVPAFALSNCTVSNVTTTNNKVFTALVTPTGATGTIQVPDSAAQNAGQNWNTASGVLSFTYDNQAPQITNVTVPANKTYKQNEILSFNVYYNENIVADTTHGAPFISLVLASGTHNATLTAISVNYLTFSYTVQNGDEDLTGPALGTGMVLNNGTIRDAVGNNAALTLQNVASLSNVWVDAKGPIVNSVSVPADGYYKAGQHLDFTLTFSEKVVVTSQPSIDVVIGSVTRHALYFSGSGSNAFVFRYTVQNGDQDMDGIAIGGPVAMNSGSIRDMSDNDLVPALNNVGNTSRVFVNTVIPSVVLSTAALSPSNQPFVATITFSEVMTGFTVGDITGTNATFSNLQTTNNITYTVLVTPTTDGAVSVQVPASVAVNVGNNDNTASNILNLTYDGTAPFISGVTLPSNGYYKLGDQLDFALQLSENVNVTAGGTSYLTLTVGTGSVHANYTGITGGNVLHYSYTVKAGDMDMDGIVVTPTLSLNGAVIKDAAGNDLLLPLQNLGSTAGIFVNTAHPSVVLSATVTGRINAPFTATLTFSEVVSGLTAGDVTLTNGTASNLQTTDHITYTVLITPSADGAVNVTLPAGVAVNIGGNDNTASNSIGVTYDGTPPVIPSGLAFVVKQNSPAGTLVGKLTATDASGIIQNWTLVRDNSGGAFALDANGNITVKDMALLNSHAGTSVVLQVTVSDGLNTTAPMAVVINIAFVNKAPTLDAIINANACATGDVYTIKLTGASAGDPQQTYTYNVSSSADLFDELTVTSNDVFRYKLKNGVTGGKATITITIKDDGGTNSGGVDTLRRTFTITVHSLPIVNISSDKGTAISKGDIANITATGGSTYRWADADGIISGDRSPVLQVRPMVKTTYSAIVTNTDGCSSTGEITIDVREDFKVDATNILTPNGDGKNDKWVIRNIDSYPDNELKIFDRAGRMVYQRRNYSNDWQGTLNGNPLAEGTYYYILSIQNGAKTAKGFITIVRDK
ncbi:MAG TPA: Ig-like domain-containing protein [Chitinophaga sp.]